MLLKKPDKYRIFCGKVESVFLSLYGKKRRIVVFALFSFCAGLIFLAGALVHRSGFWGDMLIPLIKQKYDYCSKYLRVVKARPEYIDIDVNYKNFQKLAYQRYRALQKGILIVGEEDYVPARIRQNDESVRVKMRLKGDWPEHLEGDKWSFRIRVRGNNTIHGMKQFSVHHPKTRDYLYEWVFHKALEREGLIALRYKFIGVRLNGQDLGIYALEEHFDKHLVEYNKAREGPIIRFSEDLLWEGRAEGLGEVPGFDTEMYLTSEIDAFHTNRISKNASMKKQFLKAMYLLESFRRGNLRASEVFDCEELSKFMAISDLMGAYHGNIWHNKRFYYNPITSKLEPVGFDSGSGRRIDSLVYRSGHKYLLNQLHQETLFSDTKLLRKYIEVLCRISQSSYLDQLFADLDGELKENLSILYSEFPSYSFSKEPLYQNQSYIRKILNPVKGLRAYFRKSDANHIELELGNIQVMPIEVLNVSCKSNVFKCNEAIFLAGKVLLKPVSYQNVGFIIPENLIWSDSMISDLKVHYRLLGTSSTRVETVFSWSHLDRSLVENDLIRKGANADKCEFLKINESSKQIVVKPGIWNLKQNLVIPGGYKITCVEGTQLDLSNSATILSYSPIEFIGCAERPILIQSADSTGQGLVVIDAKEKSFLKYVAFSNLSNPSQDGWELTGAVTFYQSPVDIADCQFIGNRSEDSLNLIRSQFSIDKTIFTNCSSDAFDADFCEGRVTSSCFNGCANDGVDASGSIMSLKSIRISAAGDKGLSAGENSEIRVDDVTIDNCNIGIASKDESEVVATNVKISQGEMGFAVYQKKPEFGPAKMTIDGISMMNIHIPYVVEKGSELYVNGESIKGSEKGITEEIDI